MTAIEQLQDIQLKYSTMPEANTMLCVSWGYIKVCGGTGGKCVFAGRDWLFWRGGGGNMCILIARSSIYLNIASD